MAYYFDYRQSLKLKPNIYYSYKLKIYFCVVLHIL